MKSLRKSLNGNKDHSHHIPSPSSPLPPLSKPINAIQPPKKVIKALQSHRATAPQELSFDKGDFFHVVNDVNQGQWYEAHNPISGARGLVPCSMFEVFGRGAVTSPSPRLTQAPNPVQTQSPMSPKTQVYYAIVLHDFIAERADELDAKAGDTISVVAQSNREWFVAKPIGRLGRPGLIPVSFVEIRDPATASPIQDVNALIDSGALPRVEEWKKSVMTYKANSISLGVIEDPNASQATHYNSNKNGSAAPSIDVQSPSPTPYQNQQQAPQPPPKQSILPEGILLEASVKSFHYEMEEYWFLVHATFQPYPSNSSDPLPPAKHLALFRTYNDFYDFQVELLDTFPHEAGRPDNQTRILPFMPGPVEHVDKQITITRQEELDEYIRQLCALRFSARYLLEHELVRQFVSIKPGDAEQDIEPRVSDIQALARTSYGGGPDSGANYGNDIDSQFDRLQVSQRPEPGSDVSEYEEEGDVMGRGLDGDAYDYYSQSHHPYASPELLQKPVQPLRLHNRTDSSTSLHKKTAKGHAANHSRSSSRANSPLPPSARYSSLEIDPYQTNANSRSSLASSHEPSPVSMRSSQTPSVATSATSLSGRSRSQSTATMSTPPISSNNPQTAFVKIKIFDNASDDVVAIRVHPRVTHSQLLEKVRARLPNVIALRYRDSLRNELVDIRSDDELGSWMDGADRHVLISSTSFNDALLLPTVSIYDLTCTTTLAMHQLIVIYMFRPLYHFHA
ncbi:unnamed protein product [Somion occarium]|uniref:Uncharacterized protein n=1 Tax=Somion occarium TaxID=3059160 RepID=A0ABP1D589_9APHY